MSKKKYVCQKYKKNSLRSPLILQDLLTICVVRIKKTPKQKQKKEVKDSKYSSKKWRHKLALRKGPLKFTKNPYFKKRRKNKIMSKKFFCEHWMNSLYNIHWEKIAHEASKNKKMGKNCFSQIITLVCRRTNQKLYYNCFSKRKKSSYVWINNWTKR